MSEKLSEQEIVILEQIYTYVDQKLGEGESKDKIVKELVKQNWAKETATDMVNIRAELIEEAIEEYKRTPEGRKAMASTYMRLMIKGVLWLLGGIAVTLITYALAEGGGWYFIFFGAIIFGFIDFIRGLIGWLNNH